MQIETKIKVRLKMNGWHKFPDEKPPKNRVVLVLAEASYEPFYATAVWRGEEFEPEHDGRIIVNKTVRVWVYLPAFLENEAAERFGLAKIVDRSEDV